MSTEETQTEEEEQEEDNFGTTDENYRSKYLSTLISIVVTASFIGLVVAEALGETANSVSVGNWTVFTIAFLAVIGYTIGVDTLKDTIQARREN